MSCQNYAQAFHKSAAKRQRNFRIFQINILRQWFEAGMRAGITLVMEALNTPYDHPGYWLTSSDRAAAICRQIGSERIEGKSDCEQASGTVMFLGHVHRRDTQNLPAQRILFFVRQQTLAEREA